ncbi:MAG: hypothetical protein AAB251_03435 [Deltaproteobacteria bacterium]
MNKSKNNRPTFIKLGSIKDSKIKDNTAVGDIDFADIKKVEQSQISGNKHITTIKTSSKKKWYEKPYGIILLGIVASLFAWLILRFYGFA